MACGYGAHFLSRGVHIIAVCLLTGLWVSPPMSSISLSDPSQTHRDIQNPSLLRECLVPGVGGRPQILPLLVGRGQDKPLLTQSAYAAPPLPQCSHLGLPPAVGNV